MSLKSSKYLYAEIPMPKTPSWTTLKRLRPYHVRLHNGRHREC